RIAAVRLPRDPWLFRSMRVSRTRTSSASPKPSAPSSADSEGSRRTEPEQGMNRVLVVGAGRFAEEVADVAADAGWEVVGWIEGLDEVRVDAANHPTILWVDRLSAFEPAMSCVIAIGPYCHRSLLSRT